MRFNPKADISGGRVGDAGRGGGGGMGGGGMRIPMPGGTRAGGGIGGVLVIILFLVLTQCMGGGSGGGTAIDPSGQGGNPSGLDQDSERYANCKTGADANKDVDCARKAVAYSLEQYWATDPARAGRHRVHPGADHHLQRRRQHRLRPGHLAGRPVLLPDRPAGLPRHHLLHRRAGGPARRPGRRLRRALRPRPRVRPPHPEPARHHGQGPHPAGPRAPTRCASSCRPTATPACGPATPPTATASSPSSTRRDIQEAIDSAKTVGDDRIQQKSGQRVDPEGWTHGSSEQRVRWFTTGYEQGTLEACDTFAANQL